MRYNSSSHIITAIDVGTTKICVLIAQVAPDSSLHIIGIGQALSAGLARGVVVTIAPAVHAIQMALKEAEIMAGISITHAYIGISGNHIRTFTSSGMVAIKRGEITERDITNVLQAAQAINIPEGQQVIHVMPHSFIINGVDTVQDPRGMFGVRLEAQVHIITGAVASVQNLIKCCELAGVKVRDIILEPVASAEAVLSVDECTLGVCMLDIGGGTSDFAMYQRNAIYHTSIIPIAGNVFSNDIAICLKTSVHDAERIKRLHGMKNDLLCQNQTFDVCRTDGSQRVTLSSYEITEVLIARSEELFMLIRAEIERNQLRHLAHAGLVLTGGGALLNGITEIANAILQMPVRIGKPVLTDTMPTLLEHPMYATSYGLLVHALKKQKYQLEDAQGPWVQRVVGRMKTWLYDIF